MWETIWDILNLIYEVESLSHVEHKALFNALSDVTRLAKRIESELFTSAAVRSIKSNPVPGFDRLIQKP